MGGALLLPRCREAYIARSDQPLFALTRTGVRFDIVWAAKGGSLPGWANVRLRSVLPFQSRRRLRYQGTARTLKLGMPKEQLNCAQVFRAPIPARMRLTAAGPLDPERSSSG